MLAYCLMTNYVHLVVRTTCEPLAIVMKRLGVRYAGWFNRKYGWVGHLFQDRFRLRRPDSATPAQTGAKLLGQQLIAPAPAEVGDLLREICGACRPVEFHDLPLSVRRRTVSELRTRGVRYTQIAAATGPTLYAVRKLQAAAM